MQTDARAAVRPLAEILADRAHVFVPDWNSHSADGGHADLLNSFGFARRLAVSSDGLVLVGWSMGGAAAAGLAIHAKQFDAPVAHTVCLAGAFMATDPISGQVPGQLPAGDVGAPFTLLHGVMDDVVPPAISRSFASRLREEGWPVELVELDADHGSIAGATYDPATDRYGPADDAETRAVARAVAARIAAVLPY